MRSARFNFFVSDAKYKALTGKAQNTDTIDAYVGMGTSLSTDPWNYGAATRANTEYFRGALEHEIAHAMGRFDSAYQSATGKNPPYLTPLDLYKYNAKGTLDPTRSNTQFSIDGGKTLGYAFNASSDTSDWNNQSADSFNWQLSAYQTVSATDLKVMEALGWDPAPTPEPSTWVLFSSGIGSLLGYGRCRTPNKRPVNSS